MGKGAESGTGVNGACAFFSMHEQREKSHSVGGWKGVDVVVSVVVVGEVSERQNTKTRP